MARFFWSDIAAPENISSSDWLDWRWQLRNALVSKQDFEKIFKLNDNESKAFTSAERNFAIRTTPYYAQISMHNAALRSIQVPHMDEYAQQVTDAKSSQDPLSEITNLAAPRIVHRYSDRVLFLVTDFCSVYCRFCTRKYFTGGEQSFPTASEYEKALTYIRTHPGIREVILSGGDPLTLSNEKLDKVLFDLRKISHLEIIRIGSRMPVVSPMRVDEDLLKILKKAKPVFLMTHFNHPKEITSHAASAIESFVDHGVPVMNQMVLLRGVNNHPAIVQALSRRLLYLRAKPYYMFQCDPTYGTDHLRTSIDESLAIQKQLWGHLSGLAMPNFSVDIPQGGGKTVLTPNFEVSATLNSRDYQGWDGVKASYINPPAKIQLPEDLQDYTEEWENLKNSKSLEKNSSEIPKQFPDAQI